MASSAKTGQKIPLLVLSGFLGSGKTTLLNSMLAQTPRSAVIINEFGATPIDPRLLREHKIPLSTLSGGCLCCKINGALMPVLKNLRMAWESGVEKPFDRLIIETSGIANPEPILDTVLNQPWLAARYRLQGVITTLSALTGNSTLTQFPVAQAQIAWADCIILTHTDLASASERFELTQRLKELSPATKQIHAVKGEIQLETLLSFDERIRPLPTDKAIDADHGFSSISIHFKTPVAWLKLQTLLTKLMEKHGENLVRTKAILFDPEFDHPLLAQSACGIIYPPVHLPARASDDRISRLVFIFAGSSCSEDEIRSGLL